MDDQERWEKEKEERQSELKHNYVKKTTRRDVTDEEAERIICDELKNNDWEEYLVDGARLSCTSATWDDFPLSGDESVKLDRADEERMLGEPIEYLRVPENPMSANDLRYATVADTKQGWNIMPFPCNCKEPALPAQETTVRENKVDCQSHGVCKYLMDLEEEWENCDFKEILSFSESEELYEDFRDQETDSGQGDVLMSEIRKRKTVQEKKGITMTSILFCKHGGFIYPQTSGQFSRWQGFINIVGENQLTGKQYMALYEIRNYMIKYPKLRQGTAIFVFEGLATPVSADETDWNGTNMYHPNGQFGAIVIATVDGLPKYAVMKASTLPDDMERYATICEGIYKINEGSHKGYAGVWLNDNKDIPAYNSIDHDDTAEAIHFHMAGKLRVDHPEEKSFSQGCITIPLKDYLKFGVDVNFINGEKTKDLWEIWDKYEAGDYGEAKKKLDFDTYQGDLDGYMIIDRQYYDDKGNYLKFNGPRGEE